MDSGVPHNVEIFSDAAMTQSVFRGEIVTGPKTVDYKVGSLAVGTYHFHCDIHPTRMEGTLVVK
jgi:plastocyanin